MVAVPDPAILATHRDLSPADEALRRYVAAEPSARELADPRAGELPEITRLFHYPIQPWPILLGEEKRAELARVAIGLIRLVRQVPERFFANDPDGLVALLGLPPGQRVAVLPPNGLYSDLGLARVDLIDDGTALRLLETNMTSTLGGWELRFWVDWVLARPAVTAFLGGLAAPPRHRDALAGMFEEVIRGARRVLGAGTRPLNTALVVDEPGDLGDVVGSVFRPVYQEALAAAAPGVPGELVVVPWSRLLPGAAGLEVARLPIHAIFNHSHGIAPPTVFQAFKQGRIAILNPPLHRMLGTKRVVALLSARQDDPAFSAEERQLIATHVPWTRPVAAGEVVYEDRSWPLPELLVAGRERFVLKAEKGTGGNAVVIGRASSPDVWREAVARALGGGWLVQQHVASRPYHLQGADGSPAVYDAVWGAFCFGDRYGGAYLRALPVGAGDGVINGSRGACESVVFEV